MAKETFERASTGYVMGDYGNFFTYRFAGPYLYLVVSEEQTLRLDPCQPRFLRRHRSRFHLLTLELERGTVVQDLPLGNEPLEDGGPLPAMGGGPWSGEPVTCECLRLAR